MIKNICVAAAAAVMATSSFAGELVINGSTTVLPIVQKGWQKLSLRKIRL